MLVLEHVFNCLIWFHETKKISPFSATSASPKPKRTTTEVISFILGRFGLLAWSWILRIFWALSNVKQYQFEKNLSIRFTNLFHVA
jgi:hypothetical protein